ncbi:methyltransferase [Streptomyces omiyaensis]|uniref:class I SAM-dependent methyltransferase n=1 Tax=Streptomyces omiyaensis TaxID=68247 RepID=UPI00167902BF|nr:methyltransferase [Streptomyces omiyaensis]GGY71255.1 methyltransferase [Streptomyces omiyaensis]
MTSLFTGASGYYRDYRPHIPGNLAARLATCAPDRQPRRLLDIGTGTGLVAEALLPYFTDIIASDNDPGMIATAEQALRPKVPATTTLTLTIAAAEDFAPPAGWKADLVTICRAFHWLDQEAVLARLDSQVAEDGAVAIFGDNSFWKADSDWKAAVRQVIQDFLGEQRRAGTGTFQHHNRPYSEIMRESPFSEVEEFTVPVTRTWNTTSILGYLASTSFAAPHLFGERLHEFETTVRDVLSGYSDTDTFHEDNAFLVRVGRRPA